MSTSEFLPEEISTPRLKLRPYRFADVPEMHAYLQDPEGGRYLEGPGSLLSETQTRAIVARHILVDREQRSVWAISIDDLPVGAVTINFSKQRRVAEIGYHVKKSLWRQGIASEAAQAVVDTAFATCPDLQRVQAGIHPDNEGSIRVVKKIGMVYEGTLRAYAFVRGEPADEVIYAVLREDRSNSTLASYN